VLNRVYTEWYRSRGYYYDITNHTGYDQYFVYGGVIFANISALVDQIFNRFIQREGHREPFYAEYCNGTTATCPGLSQWGSEALARQGKTPIEILRYYYPKDISIIQTNNMQAVTESYPGYPLSLGSTGDKVRVIQDYLNRIRVNYPAIPQINPPDGVFGAQTVAAVRAFQGITAFGLPTVNGVVDRATWYKIVYAYTGVKKLAELTSEGQIVGVGRTPPANSIGQGARGREVGILQFLLNFIADFYPEVPTVIRDYNFGPQTVNAVREFQRAFNITADGFVGPTTWRKLYDVYWGINDNVEIPIPPIPPYPGAPLRIGSTGTAVTQVQTCLNNIATRYPTIPKISADGQFGTNTHNAVAAFQRIFGLTQDGVVGPATWERIFTECNKIGGPSAAPPYPGAPLSVGSRGNAVSQIQICLNSLAARYPTIPRLTVDGQFGNNTRNAVIAFQRIFGLAQDGIVGPITWNRIFTECAAIGGGGGGGGGTSIPPYPGFLISLGSVGGYVRQIQECLNRAAAANSSIPHVTEDGSFGANTRVSVIAFQRAFGLPQDGVVGEQTWNRIMQQCAAARGLVAGASTDIPSAGKKSAPNKRREKAGKPANADIMTLILLGGMFGMGAPHAPYHS